ncbi:hypothetical protein J3369_19735 [Alteromonas sp. NFXS44]|uniref:hypothetical protein n=1 Tax=Alteromonas sp. NFXS44 TaxID=2818435 RepID=UPI0032E049C4
MEVENVFSVMADITTTIGIAAVVYQLFNAKRSLTNERKALVNASGALNVAVETLRADHERSRRENSVMMIREWATSLDRRGSLCRKFVESLSPEQCKSLSKEEVFEISKSQLKMAKGCFVGLEQLEVNTDTCNTEIYTLSQGQVSHLRWLISCYLNLLETLFLAAHQNIADTGIFVSQFSFLIEPKENCFMLKDYRNAVDGDKTYPSIAWMADLIKEQRKQSQPNPAPPVVSIPTA